MRAISRAGLWMVGALTLVAGCENRVGECNKLIEVINTESGKLQVKSDAAGLKAMADDLEAAAKKLEAVDLKIEPLKKFRDEYKGFMVQFAEAARAASAMQSGAGADPAKLQKSLTDLGKSAKKSTKLTDDINAFCQGKTQ